MRKRLFVATLFIAGMTWSCAADTFVFKDVLRPHGHDRSKAVKEADAICGEDEAELVKEVESFAKEKGVEIGKEEPSKDLQAELFREVILPNIGRQAEGIAALTPPEGEEETVEDLTDTLSEEVAEAEEESGVPANDTLAGATKKAKAYGLKVCGS